MSIKDPTRAPARKHFLTRLEAMKFLRFRSRNSVRRLEKYEIFHPITDKDGRTKLIPRHEVETFAKCRDKLGFKSTEARDLTVAVLNAIKSDPLFLESFYAKAQHVKTHIAEVLERASDEETAVRDDNARMRETIERTERHRRALLAEIGEPLYDLDPLLQVGPP